MQNVIASVPTTCSVFRCNLFQQRWRGSATGRALDLRKAFTFLFHQARLARLLLTCLLSYLLNYNARCAMLERRVSVTTDAEYLHPEMLNEARCPKPRPRPEAQGRGGGRDQELEAKAEARNSRRRPRPTARDQGRGQKLKAEAESEAKSSRPRPRLRSETRGRGRGRDLGLELEVEAEARCKRQIVNYTYVSCLNCRLSRHSHSLPLSWIIGLVLSIANNE